MTTAVNLLTGLPPAIRDHLAEIADESGVETTEYRSNEREFLVYGRKIETWYDEDAPSSFSAWKAFTMGVGTFSGASVEEAIARLTRKMEGT